MAFQRIMGLNVIDDERYQAYRQAMEPILNDMGGRFGYDFKIAEVLRSKTDAPINRVFTIEFPSETVMDAFFSRADYLDIKAQYFEASVADVTTLALVED